MVLVSLHFILTHYRMCWWSLLLRWFKVSNNANNWYRALFVNFHFVILPHKYSCSGNLICAEMILILQIYLYFQNRWLLEGRGWRHFRPNWRSSFLLLGYDFLLIQIAGTLNTKIFPSLAVFFNNIFICLPPYFTSLANFR